MNPDAPSFRARWGIFIGERFPPVGHLAMAAAFFSGNAAAVVGMTDAAPTPLRVICASVATLLMFFRLRIFDEIKDHETDLLVHPERPLARGLITVAEAKKVAAGVAFMEGALAGLCGMAAVIACLAVLAFSLLMFREFFVGSWLRPKMELYALTHTLIAGWMALFIVSALSGRHLWQIPIGLWGFALANWAVFNVFEFARKTLGREEEDPDVQSYSGRLQPRGAVGLSLSMVAGSAAAAHLLLDKAGVKVGETALPAIMVFAAVIVSLFYVSNPRRKWAVLYRNFMRVFIIAYYLALAACVFYMKIGE